MTSGSTMLAERPLTEIDFLGWLGQAEPGDVLHYHRGFLALDRSCCGQAQSKNNRVTLGPMADLAMRLADRGLVHLVQRRNGSNDSSYLAIARARSCDLSQFL